MQRLSPQGVDQLYFHFFFPRFNMEELDMGLSLTNKKRLRGSTNNEIPCVYELKIAQ